MDSETFHDISKICVYVSSEVVRGTLGPETAAAVTNLIELAFTAVAAHHKGQDAAKASTAISSLVAAIQQAEAAPKILPSYTVLESEEAQQESAPAVVIDITSVSNG